MNKNSTHGSIISRKKEYMKTISELNGFVKHKRNEFNIKITDDAILHLMLKELTKRKKDAPQCRGLKKDGINCQNKTHHPSGYCPHHR